MREDWIECEADLLGDLIRGINYKKPQSSDSQQKGYLPILRANNIKGNTLNFDDLKYVEQDLVKSEQKILRGDIVFAMSSGSKHLVGKSGQAKSDYKGSFGAFCSVFRPNKSVDPNFIQFYFHSGAFRRIISNASKGSNINNLKREHVLNAIIPLPSTSEQRAIVSKIEELFSDLDKGVTDLKKAQDQLKIYRQAVLKKAFEGDWSVIKIGEVFDFLGGGTPSKKEKSYWNGNIPWASVKDIKGDYLFHTLDSISALGLDSSSANLAKKSEVILITRISPGKTIISNIDTAINQDLKIVKPKIEMFNKFIHFLFKSIERKIVKLSSGTTVKGINLNNLKSIEIPHIGLIEQRRIVQEIESRLSICDKVEENITKSLEKAKALRQSILKKAFEGRLLSNEEIEKCKTAADYEPAAVLLEKIKMKQ